MPDKPGRKTNVYADSVNTPERLSEYVYTSEAMIGRVRVHTPPKRLEFRLDPSKAEDMRTRVDELIDAMADLHKIKRDTFRQRSVRDHDLIFAQQITWFVLRNRWFLPYELLSSYFEHHRTTIIHGVQNAQNAYETDPGFAQYLDLMPFYLNVDTEAGRIIAIQALFEPKVGKDTPEGVKTSPRARKGAKNGIAGQRKVIE